MVEVVNRQRRLQGRYRRLEQFAPKALEAIGKGESSATIAFISDKRIEN